LFASEVGDDEAAFFVHFDVFHDVHANLSNGLICPIMSHCCHHHIISHCVQTICLNWVHLIIG